LERQKTTDECGGKDQVSRAIPLSGLFYPQGKQKKQIREQIFQKKIVNIYATADSWKTKRRPERQNMHE